MTEAKISIIRLIIMLRNLLTSELLCEKVLIENE